MKPGFFGKPVMIVWGGGFFVSLILTIAAGGSFGSCVIRLLLNALLLSVFMAAVILIWNRFLKEGAPGISNSTQNDEEDEIVLESDSNRDYTEKGDNVLSGTDSVKDPGALFSDYQYRNETKEADLRHMDNKNPYQMSDALLRKFKEEEEDSIAKFKAAFQSPEEIAKAVRTEMHKDG